MCDRSHLLDRPADDGSFIAIDDALRDAEAAARDLASVTAPGPRRRDELAAAHARAIAANASLRAAAASLDAIWSSWARDRVPASSVVAPFVDLRRRAADAARRLDVAVDAIERGLAAADRARAAAESPR